MFNAKFKTLAFVAAATFSALPSQAATPIVFTPSGDTNTGNLKCDVPIGSLGSMLLKSGSANISGRVVTIKAGSAYIDAPRTVLIGSVLRTEANLSSDPPNVTGLALFLMGDWKDQFDDGNTKDMIFRKEGHIDGRILGLEDDVLSVNVNGIPQNIPLSSILYIRSPRVFVFKISLKTRQPLPKDAVIQADAGEVSFRPTSTARTLSGSVIQPSDRKENAMTSLMGGLAPGGGGGLAGMTGGVPGLGGGNVMGGMGGVPGPGMNTMNRPQSAVPNPQDDSLDDGEEAARFSQVKTKYGTEKLSLPPGILD